jgi:predicted TPR repeat methyltransferase
MTQIALPAARRSFAVAAVPDSDEPDAISDLPELPDAQAVAAAIKEWADSLPAFARLLANGAPVSDALTRISLEFAKENRVAEAVAVARAVVALQPGNAILWMDFGAALDRAGDTRAAAACFERSLQLEPRSADAWLLLGLTRKKLGDLEEGARAYDKAIKLDPASAIAWQCMGLLRQEQRDYPAAIQCLTTSVKLGAGSPAVMANLGKLHFQLGDFQNAARSYAKATQLDGGISSHFALMTRKSRFVCELSTGQSVDDAVSAYRQSAASATAPTDDEERDLLQYAMLQLSGFGYTEAAGRVGRRHQERWPGNAIVEHMLRANSNGPAPAQASRSYVTEFYDSFAEGFEAQLVGALGYDAPQKMREILGDFVPPGKELQTLDAGCGTGLCGPWLRPWSRHLVGVDLSPKMLDQAARRGLYDELVCADLIEFLGRAPGRFDLVTAADVLIYIGDFAPLFAAAAKALRPDGLFAFSTETVPGDTYQLLPSGRFAHPVAYVRAAAKAAFDECKCVETTLRLDASRRLPGHLFVLQRRA